MGQTSIPTGSPAGNRLFNAALFAEAIRRNSMTNLLTGDAPKTIKKSKVDPRKQTSAGTPIVRATDLTKEKGDEITVDLYHQLSGKPVMGDRPLAGRVEGLTSSQFSLKINQGRKAVGSGGKMTQQRTKQNLKSIAKTMIGPWWSRLDDQLTMVHLAGARGDDVSADWNVPLASDPEFAEILVNPLRAPTYDRHVIGGDATSFGDIDSADIFSMKEVDKLRLLTDEMAYPLQPIKYENDPGAEEDPFYVLLVSPRMWHDFTTSDDGKVLRELQAAAIKRGSEFKHPIFRGDCAMWKNILVRKMSRPITFNAGSTVAVSQNNNDATQTSDTAGVKIERGLLLGAQALITAYGRHGTKESGGYHFSMHTETVDHGNAQEHSIAWINGKAKTQFRGSDGRLNDHGVIALDCAVSG
ncbi:N4-gp56 family major capsid protein [Gilvimarinus chinensis]|uniref:N4-gp56 family major capsid protein n=1 Tax=Gilvimarinus chinensis TaxID=396005 RepID=UPI00037A7613|nr:N4-gp56 family major capsid protein [Gilvimarinus chinensis]